jgi:hypothetical protein
LDDQRVTEVASFGPSLLQTHVLFLHNPVIRSQTVNMAKAKAMWVVVGLAEVRGAKKAEIQGCRENIFLII